MEIKTREELERILVDTITRLEEAEAKLTALTTEPETETEAETEAETETIVDEKEADEIDKLLGL